MSAEDVAERLAALEARWAPYGGREGMRLRPGLGDAAMDALVAPIGYTLDEEQRAWWRWADGTEETDVYFHGRGHVFPGVPLAPLHLAVQEYEHLIEQNKVVAPGVLWPAHWLQVTVDDMHPVVSAATGTDRTQVSSFDPENGTDPVLESLAHLIDVWLYVWDSGNIRPTTSAPGWVGTWPELPNELLTLGVLPV